MNARRTRHSARALASALALTAVLGWAASAAADSRDYSPGGETTPHWNATGGLVDVQIEVDGASAPLYFRPGAWDRHYFQAFQGRNYSIVVHNTSGERVGVLLTVDGLNVVNGERSKLDRNEPMYVLDPYETATLSGWRTSLDEVRRFVFVDEDRSYAERTGQANGDLGWIRVLSFQEQRPWWSPPQRLRRPLAQDEDRGGALPPAPSEAPRAKAAPEAQGFRGDGPSANANPGTGWGDRRHDPVTTTEFDPARKPTDQLVLRYEYASGLQALGIFPAQDRLWEREHGQLGFAKPPRW